MLASRYRLTGSENIEKVKNSGNLHQFDLFGIVIQKRKDKEPSRFAFVISTKVSKLAVQRNRIKRALHEAVRQSITNVKKGNDVVFLTKKSIEKVPTDEIMHNTRKALREVGLLK
jgi:ribonuclease P protein component